MTEQEKNEILNELEARFEKKYKGCLTKEDTQSILKEPRNKWFRDTQGSCSNSLMADAFDNSIIAWQVWETIRKLTCVVCGKQYVRHLEKDDHAEEIAEELCQFVYDLRESAVEYFTEGVQENFSSGKYDVNTQMISPILSSIINGEQF